MMNPADGTDRFAYDGRRLNCADLVKRSGLAGNNLKHNTGLMHNLSSALGVGPSESDIY